MLDFWQTMSFPEHNSPSLFRVTICFSRQHTAWTEPYCDGRVVNQVYCYPSAMDKGLRATPIPRCPLSCGSHLPNCHK
jgi:hypothetical protein